MISGQFLETGRLVFPATRRTTGAIPARQKSISDSTIESPPYVLANEAGVPVPNAIGEFIPVLPKADDPKTLSPEAQLIADAARDVLAGTTLRRIVNGVNERGIPGPRKPNRKTLADNPDGVVSRWTPEPPRQRLINPTVAGRRVYRGQDIGQATWAPIIDHATWLKLHAILTDPSRRSFTAPADPSRGTFSRGPANRPCPRACPGLRRRRARRWALFDTPGARPRP